MDKTELRRHAEALSSDAMACIQAVLIKHNMGLIEAAHEHGQQFRAEAPNTGPLPPPPPPPKGTTMHITIFGDHTAPYGDHPYSKGNEFERALKADWEAILFFSFNSNSAAVIHIDQHYEGVGNMTVAELHARVRLCVERASKECEWEIWEVKEFEVKS